MGIRRRAREMALQALYQGELSNVEGPDSFKTFCQYFETNKKAVQYANDLIDGLSASSKEVDELIQNYSANWRLGRMLVIDRNILRLALYEMCFAKDSVPASVVINEALEIARKFSSDESCSFINGILDAVRKDKSLA